MEIINLHGLNGSPYNTNYVTISEFYKDNHDVDVISLSIDYENESPYSILGKILNNCHSHDVVAGNSFGGFFAYVIGCIINTKTILVNPCIPPHKYIGNLVPNYRYLNELEEIWNTCSGKNSNYKMLLGDSDEVLDIQTTLNVLNPRYSDYKIIPGGHSLKGIEYQNWFKEQLI